MLILRANAKKSQTYARERDEIETISRHSKFQNPSCLLISELIRATEIKVPTHTS